MVAVNGLNYTSNTISPDLNLQKTDSDYRWTERAVANIKFNYQNQLNYLSNKPVFDENWDMTFDMIPDDLKNFAPILADSQSQSHFDNQVMMVRKGLETRAARNQTGFFESLAYEIIDPINFIALPFGGPSFGIVKSGVRVGAGITALIAAKEATRYAVDPLATATEVGLEVGSAAVFGSIFGGLLAVSPTLKAKATAQSVLEHKNVMAALDGLTPDDISLLGARDSRPMGRVSFTGLRTNLKKSKKQRDKQNVKDINQEIALRELEGYKDKDQNSIYKENNFFVRGVSTPFKRYLRTALTTTKSYMAELAGDSALLTMGNLAGEISGSSVYVKAKVRRGQVYKAQLEMTWLWADDIGGATTFAGYNPTNFIATAQKAAGVKGKVTIDDWMSGVSKKRILEDFDNMTPNEKKASDILDDYFSKYEVDLRENGLIGSAAHYKKSILKDSGYIIEHEKKLKSLTDKRAKEKSKRIISRLKERVEQNEKLLEDAFENPNTPTGEKHFFARYFDIEAIKADRQGFTTKIFNHYKAHPHPKKLNTPEAIQLRAEETVKKIIQERHDPIDPDKLFLGAGSAKHTISRTLDIPNRDVADFLETNPMDVMYEYDRRIAPSLEFKKRFGDRDIEDLLDEIELDGIASGMSERKINAALKDFRHMYDRVVGVVKRDPSKMSHKIGYFMSELATTSFLGSSGLATISEPAKMLMNNKLQTVFRSLFSMLDRFDDIPSLGMRETMLAGEGWEVRAGGAQKRFMEEMMSHNKYAKVWGKAKNAFFTLNGLTPITAFLKNWESLSRQHTIIDSSIRWSQGKNAVNPITSEERNFLIAYNIDFKTAQKIAKSPWQKTRAGQYVANTEAWLQATEFPDVADGVKIVSERDSGKIDPETEAYVPAYYNSNSKTIFIDEEYLTETFKKKPWLSPRKKGVTPLPDDMFKTPQDWIDFVKMHEILHTTNRPENMGFKTITETKVTDDKLTNQNIKDYYANKLDNELDSLQSFSIDPDEFLELNLSYEFKNKVFRGILDGKIKSGDDIKKLKGWKKMENKDEFIEVSSDKVIDEAFEKDYAEAFNNLVDKDYGANAYKELFDIHADTESGVISSFVRRYGEGLRRKDANKNIFNKGIGFEENTGLQNLIDDEVIFGQYAKGIGAKYKKQYEVQFKAYYGKHITDAEFKENFLDILFKQAEDYHSDTVNILLNKHVEMKTVMKQDASIYTDIDADRFFSKIESDVSSAKNTIPKVNEIKTTVDFDVAGYENKINELAMERINSQDKVGQETIDSFREAMSNGILNTVLMASPADRPIVMDNVMYVPMNVAKYHPFLKEDPKFKGYARIENGLLARPLQFYSYLMAAVTKINGSLSQNPSLKTRALVVSAFMGLGYLQYRARVPDYIREKDNWSTVFARSIDYSGLGSVYSDIMYQSIHTALALGMDNKTPINPKYNQKKNLGEAITGVMGAGPSISYDFFMGFKDMVQGDVGKGGGKVISLLPFAKTIWWKRETADLARAFGRMD